MSDPSWKPRTGQSIDAIYAWVATEPDGGEGVIAAALPGIGITPLIGADMDRIKSYRSIAEDARAGSGYPVRLVRYGAREDLEVLP